MGATCHKLSYDLEFDDSFETGSMLSRLQVLRMHIRQKCNTSKPYVRDQSPLRLVQQTHSITKLVRAYCKLVWGQE